ncbi:MAG: riboflavin synthase [Magnetococcales bacterium]|nr:riboflavin synthase [Magnetococcales bacterium]
MFTGLIEEVGTVRSLKKSSQDWRVGINCDFDLSSVRMGASIAVNGACLTVVEKSASHFSVDVSAESVHRTTFAKLSPGDLVNLERALAVGGRLDGHIVQGHVDAVGRVERAAPRGRSIEIWFRVPASAGRYIISKGSIAVDGVSLTVNQVEDVGEATRFSVNIIPHTQLKTTLTGLGPGGEVNIETDLLGRYVERLLKGGLGKASRGIDEAYLIKKGFV